jgi:hypothetical protein
MTKGKKFKRTVRDRMAKTGESYAAARAQLDRPKDERPSGSTLVHVASPRLDPDAMEAMLKWFSCPPDEALPAIHQICARLHQRCRARTVLCWDLRFQELAAFGSTDAEREQIQQKLREPTISTALELIAPLSFQQLFGDHICFRRIGWMVQLVVVFHPDQCPLELIKLHVGHAALAIERLLPRQRRLVP